MKAGKHTLLLLVSSPFSFAEQDRRTQTLMRGICCSVACGGYIVPALEKSTYRTMRESKEELSHLLLLTSLALRALSALLGEGPGSKVSGRLRQLTDNAFSCAEDPDILALTEDPAPGWTGSDPFGSRSAVERFCRGDK
jgi:hypothetical protein